MIFCHGCGKEIHETAITCPHCGAPQAKTSAVAVSSGDEVKPFDWYLRVLKNYAQFGGRARRKEYWFYMLFGILISIGLGILDGITGMMSYSAGMGALGSLYALGTFIPSLAVTARRLHDTDRSAWWMLIVLLPLVGAIILIVFLASDSQATENQYGPNPKGR